MPTCRFCGAALRHTFVDLGMSPLCESYVPADRVNAMEAFYPLHAKVCESCLLVQLEEFVTADAIFSEYAYFSSYSDSWVAHARNYVEMAVERFGLDASSLVVELASNDGYLLQHVVGARDPGARDRARRERRRGGARARASRRSSSSSAGTWPAGSRPRAAPPTCWSPTTSWPTFPTSTTSSAASAIVLAPDGVATIEVPHLLRLVESNQFDTIYHEHFSYFSLLTARKVLEAHGLELFDVDELKSHGGSLRFYAQRAGTGRQAVSPARGGACRARARAWASTPSRGTARSPRQVHETKWRLLEFLIARRREGKRIAGYGAPGKGNTLLNFCGIRTDLLDYTVDRNPYKQGQFLPGTHIPIKHPEALEQDRPDYILILPWNLKDEIVQQLAYAREWGAQFVVPIPEVQVL